MVEKLENKRKCDDNVCQQINTENSGFCWVLVSWDIFWPNPSFPIATSGWQKRLCSLTYLLITFGFTPVLFSSLSPFPCITTFRSFLERIEATPVERDIKPEFFRSAVVGRCKSWLSVWNVFASPSGVFLISASRSIEGLGGGISSSELLVIFVWVTAVCRILVPFLAGLVWPGWALWTKDVLELLSRSFDLSPVFKIANSFFDCLVSSWSSFLRRNFSLLNDFPPKDIAESCVLQNFIVQPSPTIFARTKNVFSRIVVWFWQKAKTKILSWKDFQALQTPSLFSCCNLGPRPLRTR